MHSSLFRRVLVAASLAGALTVSGLSPIALAAPTAPSNLTPASTDVSGTPVLSWTRVPTAEKYDVQVSLDDSFGTLVYTVQTSNKRATPTVNFPLRSEVYWRVRGVTSAGTPGIWSIASFTTSAKAGPELLSPLNEASLQQPGEPPLLTWDVVPGAVGYSVEIDSDDMFIDPIVKTTKTPSYLVSDPGPEQTYYWRVRATFAGGYASDYSDSRSFKVLSLEAPLLTYPGGESTAQVQDAVLDWLPVAGAATYEVRVSTDDQFNTIVDAVVVKSTRYARPSTLNNDQYWWQVRAIDVNGNKSPWSTSLSQFQRNWPDQPELVYPADGSTVHDSMYYEWEPVPHASEYRLEVAPDPSFSPNTYDICTTKATTYAVSRITPRTCSTLVQGTYYWRVRPLDAPASPAINGIYSEIHSFTFDPGQVTQLPVETNASGQSVVPTLRWNAYAGAEKYKVTVRKANGAVVVSTTTFALSWTPTGNKWLPANEGPYRWTVQALGADGLQTQTRLDGGPSFTLVDGPFSAAGAALTPTSPNNEHSVRFPALSWVPDPAARYYQVFVGDEGSNSYFALGDKFAYPAATDDTSQFLVPGDYEWFVAAYGEGDVSLGSGPLGHFTIDPLDSVTGRVVTLTGAGLGAASTRCSKALGASPTPADICGNLQQTPVFGWDRIDGAGFYMVYLYKDRELTNLVDSSLTPAVLKTANRTLTLTSLLPDSQAGTAYYWVVRPCKTEGVCAPEPIKATNAFDKRSNPITGLVEREHDSAALLPAHGPSGPGTPPEFADEVVLSWDDYLGTNQAGNDLDVTGLPATVGARSYTVQISTSPNFTAGVVTTSGLDQTSYSPYATTLPEGPLYWRVQAVDASGNALAWSLARNAGDATQAIQKRSPAPDLIAPGQDAKVSGTPALKWAAQNYAARYEVQVSRNGDDTFSSSTRVFNETGLEQATYVPTRTLDPTGSPYVWRVRRTDADGKAGPWSAVGRFTVKGSAPSLISPSEGVRLSATDSMFTWSAVAEAEQYRFERRTEGSTSVVESVRTVGLNWAPVVKMPDGRYEWRVSAVDADGKVLGSTGWRRAFVDSSGPEIVANAPTSTAKPKTNVVVTFDERVKGLTSATMAIFADGNKRRVSAKVTLNAARTKATLNPVRNLKVKQYTVKLSPRITDVYGNKLLAYSWRISIVR